MKTGNKGKVNGQAEVWTLAALPALFEIPIFAPESN
jgi:hypothetical protein